MFTQGKHIYTRKTYFMWLKVKVYCRGVKFRFRFIRMGGGSLVTMVVLCMCRTLL